MIYFILFLGLVLRLISLNQSLWLDEATTAFAARMPLGELFNKFLPGDFHPPFYYLLMKFWVSIFGSDEISLRVPSVIFALAAIYLVYLLGRKLFNNRVGYISAFFLATSGLFIYYSQEARMYSLTAFLVTLSFFSFVKILKQGRVGDWIVFSFTIALVALTDYMAILVLPIFWISLVGLRKDKLYWKKFVASHIILLVFGLFWLPVFTKQLNAGLLVSASSPSWWKILGTTNIKNILLVPVKFMLGRVGFYHKWIYMSVVLVSACVFGYPLIKSLLDKKAKLIWLWFAFPIASVVVLGIKIPVLSYFRLLFVLPAFYLLVAYGLSKIKPDFIAKLLVTAILSVNFLTSGMYLFNSRFQREDWRDLVSFIEDKSEGNSIALFVAESNMEAYRYYSKGNDKIAGPKGIQGGYKQIWLMRYLQDVFDPQDKLKAKIEELEYKKQAEYDFNGVVVWKYEKSSN